MIPVTLTPLSPDHDTALRDVMVKPWQQVFSGHAAQALDAATPGQAVHVILLRDAVIGLFIADTRYHHSHTFAPADSIGIHSMIINHARQGNGYGTAACRLLPRYLHRLHPLKKAAYATVNTRNTGARKCFLAGGWTDTGSQHLTRPTGPEQILRLALA